MGAADMPFAHLPHRALILVDGTDAAHLLEGLITSELPSEGEVVGSALLTPQGKILFTFLISQHGDGFAIECDASERRTLLQRLTMYKLRADVTLIPSDLPVHAREGGGLVDRRHADLGVRIYGDADVNETPGAYDAKRVQLGVLEGPTEILPNQDFPHDVALDLVGAVSFTKGCFVGQEVVSRVKHRGTARRRPVLVEGANLEVGQTVSAGDREVGTLRSVAGDKAIAVVRIDQLKAGPTTINGQAVTLALPPYATYSLEAEPTNEDQPA